MEYDCTTPIAKSTESLKRIWHTMRCFSPRIPHFLCLEVPRCIQPIFFPMQCISSRLQLSNTCARLLEAGSSPINSIIRGSTLQPAPGPTLILTPKPTIPLLSDCRFLLLHHLFIDTQPGSIFISYIISGYRRDGSRPNSTAGIAARYVENEILKTVIGGATVGLGGSACSWRIRPSCFSYRAGLRVTVCITAASEPAKGAQWTERDISE